MASLRSVGVPYLTPMAPFIAADQKDALIRVPIWKMFTRPRLISQSDIVRENTTGPKPPDQTSNRGES